MKTPLALICLTLLIQRCSEVNTSDPQVSRNIEESQKKGLFLLELGNITGIDSIFDFGKIWIEQRWRNAIVSNKTEVTRTEGLQLVIQISHHKSSSFKEGDYNIGWTMKELDNGFVGKSGSLYFLSLKNETIQRVYNFLLIKYRQGSNNDTLTFSIKKQ